MTGSGTQADPYIIYNATDLQAMENNLAAYYELANDIDASATSGWNAGLGFDPIGTYDGAHPEYAFRGNFDGKGYKITDLFINRPLENYVGLFGYTGLVGGYGGDARVIQDIGLEDCDITGGDYSVAGLIGFNDHARAITDCWVEGDVTANGGGIALCGGLTGYADGAVTSCYFSGTLTLNDTTGSRSRQNGGLVGLLGGGAANIVTNCYTTGIIDCNGAAGSDFWELGGFVGLNNVTTISKCYSTMDIDIDTGDEAYAIGGFIGNADAGGTIDDCYATGTVDVTAGDLVNSSHIGGFVGIVTNASSTITNCYSVGAVTTNVTSDVGGFCGEIFAGTITNSFWDTETSGQATSDGGTGKTTAQMNTQSTFTAAGWDTDIIWGLFTHCNNGYPCLREVTPSCEALVTAPEVSTDEASGVGQELADLNLTLDDDGGEACACGFEWGRTTDYGSTTATENKETGETFSQEISGLTPNTEYHFRAFATNSAGTSYGDDVMFTTQQRPLVNYRPIVNRSYALSRHEV